MKVNEIFNEGKTIAGYDADANKNQQREIAIRQVNSASAALDREDHDLTPENVVAWIKARYKKEDINLDLIRQILNEK